MLTHLAKELRDEIEKGHIEIPLYFLRYGTGGRKVRHGYLHSPEKIYSGMVYRK